MKIEGYPGEWEVKNCQHDNVLVLEKVEPEIPVLEVWIDDDGLPWASWKVEPKYLNKELKEWAWVEIAGRIAPGIPNCKYIAVDTNAIITFYLKKPEYINNSCWVGPFNECINFPDCFAPKDCSNTLVKVVHR